MTPRHALFFVVAAVVISLAAWLPSALTPETPPIVVATPLDAGVKDEPAPPDAAVALTLEQVNPGFIGASCSSDADCRYDGGICRSADAGYPGGMCTLACRTGCPERRGDVFAATLCVDDPTDARVGMCVARCALHLGGLACREGYVCASSTSRRDSSVDRLACVPDWGTPAPENECTSALREASIPFTRPDIADAQADVAGTRRTCQVDTPVLLPSPIRTVDFREHGRRLAEHLFVSCRMAHAVDALARVLAGMDVVEVEHVGTYNCRGVAGSSRLSAHAQGRALDIRGFERATGTPVIVERHWNGRDAEARKFLRTLVARLRADKTFRMVLAPDSDARHKDHLHLEIAP